MADSRNPMKDQVAIAGLGYTRYGRNLEGKTAGSLAIEACKNAILDAGLSPKDIDGMAGSVSIPWLSESLGVEGLTWWGSGGVFTFPVVAAATAVFSGQCTYALVFHAQYRNAGRSQSASRDAMRVRISSAGGGGGGGSPTQPFYSPYARGAGVAAGFYAGWMSRYIYEYKAKREYFGLMAINCRTNAGMNDHAVMRSPMTMEDYLDARMVREPMGMLDMDLPVDGADAFVITTAERAKDLKTKPVYLHAASFGQTAHPEDDQAIDLRHMGQHVALDSLWSKSDLKLKDADVFLPYDGFTIITLNWLENVGYCAKGEAGPFMESNWDKAENRVKINGRVPINTHGGSLSDGATQGAGHTREAVIQLRGDAGQRQVPNAKAALITPGGFFINSSAMILRAD